MYLNFFLAKIVEEPSHSRNPSSSQKEHTSLHQLLEITVLGQNLSVYL